MNDETFFTRWRANFFTGLAIVLPAIISAAVLAWIFGTVSSVTDTLLFFLPDAWTHRPDGSGKVYWHWSAVAFVLAVVIITLVGRYARHYFAERAIHWMDRLLLKVPLMNKIYGTVKQVNEAFSSNKSSFKQVVLVKFPHAAAYSIGFVTGEPRPLKAGEKLVTVFVPTTPNPTSGFLLLLPESEITKLDMTVAEGIKFLISLGAIPPEQQRAEMRQMSSLVKEAASPGHV